MNKEGLEAFNDIKQLVATIEFAGKKDGAVANEELNTIEKELKELYERREMMARFNEACEPHIIEDEVYKKARALDILKKYIDIQFFFANYEITQEEYDLLREVGL